MLAVACTEHECRVNGDWLRESPGMIGRGKLPD